MKPPPPPALARWLPALAVWSAVLLSLLLGDRDPATVLARDMAVPCAPLHLAGSAG